MHTGVTKENISIVLNRPRFPENIGSAARAMKNMGISDLVVVAPEIFDKGRVKALATHAALDVVENIRLFDTLAKALAPFSYVVGTTARLGDKRQALSTPARLAEKLVPISAANRVAIVFGPEDRGLTNPELSYCHSLVTIPTADFSSLNLAQAVMIISYELFRAGIPAPKEFAPRLATRFELDPMYGQLTDLLVRISYIQPDNPDHWMHKIRKALSRVSLKAAEVSIIRGICRQVNWYAKKCYSDGRKGLLPDPALGIDNDFHGPTES
ncbi:MAG: RNA methyltransferase [Deltaproteobacteria bacterium]|nr:RNA methyltransferase [Deltaproteobacteria bacterium]